MASTIVTMAATTNANENAATKLGDTEHPHIWIVIGPAGCGKSVIGRYIADTLDLPFLEGDEYHPEANIKKMSAGIPLVDSDRWDWLTRLQEECLDRLSGSRGLVVTCSALKRKYRDVIRAAVAYNHNLVVRFVYLSADEALLIQRVGARLGHFFGADLVHSQMIILEEPKPRENDIIKVDVSGDLESVKKEVLARIHRVYQKDPYLDDTPPSSPA